MSGLEAFIQQDPPEHLYHYTTSPGLIGILKSRSLWATSHLHLNDRKEYKIADSLVREELDKARLKPLLRRMFLGLLRKAQGESFVLSLSENGDLLSQWRAYCPDGNGYSLGFAPGNPLFRSAKQNSFNLVRCVYKEKEQRALTKELISTFQGQYIRESMPEDAAATIRLFFERYEWWYSFQAISSGFKHAGFAEEREWRFVSQYPENLLPDLRYRSGRFGITPYFPLPTAPKDQVSRVDLAVIGPNANRAAARSALTLLTQTSKHAITKIETSKTPLRQR